MARSTTSRRTYTKRTTSTRHEVNLPATDPRGRLPVDPRTGEPLAPRAQPGYYPGF